MEEQNQCERQSSDTRVTSQSTFPSLRLYQKPRILIVEDDVTLEPLWSYIIERVDRSAQYLWAGSIAEAEQVLDSDPDGIDSFSVVITDIFLSGPKTGIELWSKYHPILNGRIVMVSAVEYDQYLQYFKGPDGRSVSPPMFIQKPINPSECIEMIDALLKSSY